MDRKEIKIAVRKTNNPDPRVIAPYSVLILERDSHHWEGHFQTISEAIDTARKFYTGMGEKVSMDWNSYNDALEEEERINENG